MSKSIVIWKGFWSCWDVKKNKDHLFVFGDNDIKQGKKGQSIIRDEPNSIGIATKKRPGYSYDAYYTDKELELNKKKIVKAISDILEQKDRYRVLVLPEDGLGTGLANLPKCAPETYQYLLNAITVLKAMWLE